MTILTVLAIAALLTVAVRLLLVLSVSPACHTASMAWTIGHLTMCAIAERRPGFRMGAGILWKSRRGVRALHLGVRRSEWKLRRSGRKAPDGSDLHLCFGPAWLSASRQQFQQVERPRIIVKAVRRPAISTSLP